MSWDKKVSQSEAVKAFLVTVDGRVNLEASVEKFRSVAVRALAKQESDDDLICSCMSSLFDQFPGASLNLDYVTSKTVEAMGQRVPELKDPSLFSQLRERVATVLHENTDQPARGAKGDKPAVEAITDRLYAMKKGTGGGFYRKADQPVKG